MSMFKFDAIKALKNAINRVRILNLIQMLKSVTMSETLKASLEITLASPIYLLLTQKRPGSGAGAIAGKRHIWYPGS